MEGNKMPSSLIITKTYELKSRIIKAGFTGKSFAEKAGISQSYIVQILAGRKNVSPPTAKKICDALQCSFDDIFVLKFNCDKEKTL